MIQAERLMTPSCQCIHFVAVDGESFRDRLAAAEVRLVTFDVAHVRAKQDLFDLLARSLRFPEYFGQNWDAVDECLRDLAWLPAKGYVIWVTGSEAFWRDNTRVAGTFLEVVLGAAEAWAARKVSFHLVFQIER